MARPVTLFTGQWADLTLEDLAKKVSDWGFDGLELACWGDHFEVDKALEDDGYIQSRLDILNRYNLECYAISTHLVGQCVADDPIDDRHKGILPSRLWGDGDPEGVRQRAAEEVKNTAIAAKKLGVGVVNGFTGSSVWKNIYFFPPTSQEDIDKGYEDFANRWVPILDVFAENDVKFGLEVHPTEIAYDIITSQRALEAVDHHPAFGFNFDPSHFIHQFLDPVEFVTEFADRIWHMHVKDSRVQLTGRNSILSSHLGFGDHRRGWDFVSPGRGDVKWDEIIRALNRIGYDGPLSIEWEDSGMDRDWGAPEALKMVRMQDFTPSSVAFDAAFASDDWDQEETHGFNQVLVTEGHHPWWENWWPHGHIIGWEHTFVHEITHLLDCIVNDKEVGPYGATFEDGYKTAVICDAIVELAEARRQVDIKY